MRPYGQQGFCRFVKKAARRESRQLCLWPGSEWEPEEADLLEEDGLSEYGDPWWIWDDETSWEQSYEADDFFDYAD